ncbi:hypothetical protein, partial [Pseudomonas aeruginosa]|uniref:hypothetical protein n=1 Tax=Pseudomonas aeruginosa TaxID=287 RepID=UPI003968492E
DMLQAAASSLVIALVSASRGLEESLCEPVCSLSRIHTGLNYERLCRTICLVWLGCCGELGMPFRYIVVVY